jgi:hypothetical protein
MADPDEAAIDSQQPVITRPYQQTQGTSLGNSSLDTSRNNRGTVRSAVLNASLQGQAYDLSSD